MCYALTDIKKQNKITISHDTMCNQFSWYILYIIKRMNRVRHEDIEGIVAIMRVETTKTAVAVTEGSIRSV